MLDKDMLLNNKRIAECKNFQNLLNNNCTNIEECINSMYIIGQASVIATILSIYSDNSEIMQLQSELRQFLNNDDQLKSNVYDIMKDF